MQSICGTNLGFSFSFILIDLRLEQFHADIQAWPPSSQHDEFLFCMKGGSLQETNEKEVVLHSKELRDSIFENKDER